MQLLEKSYLENLGFEITDAQKEINKIVEKESQRATNITLSQVTRTGADSHLNENIKFLREIHKHLNNAYLEIQNILNQN